LNSGSNTYDTHFAGIHAALQGSNLIDFTMDQASYRFYAPNPGRWHSPDPLASDITNPQSLNSYAYVMNSPTTFVDPLGLVVAIPPGCRSLGIGPDGEPIIDCSGLWGGPTTIFGFQQPPGQGPGGNNGGGAGPGLDISKSWQRTVPCTQGAQSLISDLTSDFASFANNPGPGPSAQFLTNGPIQQGGTVLIAAGASLTSNPNNSVPANLLAVTVSTVTPNSWTFVTNPAQHYFNGTITFMASDVPGGQVNFVVTANANYANTASWLLGPLIKAGENSTWNNLLSNIQAHCKQ